MRRCAVHLSFLDVSHFSCNPWRLSCLMIFFSSSCSPRCWSLSTDSISMDVRPTMINTASSDTVRKALDTLRALRRLTAAILRRYFSILKASTQMAVPYRRLRGRRRYLGLSSKEGAISMRALKKALFQRDSSRIFFLQFCSGSPM